MIGFIKFGGESMNLNVQSNTNSFKGTIVYTQYAKNGLIKKNLQKETTPVQDRLVKLVANSMTPDGSFSNRLSIENANIFKSLIEMIIKKPIKESGQQKLLDNCFQNAVVFSDKAPGKDGITVLLDFKNNVD